jgi:iron complex transport system ATP-binding protein
MRVARATLIMITHSVDDIIPEVNRLALLKDGTIVALNAKEALLTNETLSSLFEVPMRVIEKNGRYLVTLER